MSIVRLVLYILFVVLRDFPTPFFHLVGPWSPGLLPKSLHKHPKGKPEYTGSEPQRIRPFDVPGRSCLLRVVFEKEKSVYWSFFRQVFCLLHIYYHQDEVGLRFLFDIGVRIRVVVSDSPPGSKDGYPPTLLRRLWE